MAKVKRIAVKYKPSVRRSAEGAKFNGPHAHACTTCGERYGDNCANSPQDEVCPACKAGHGWPLWRTNRLPADCCKIESAPTTKDDRALYRLGGAVDWWICKTCKRTHPYDPKEKTP